MFHLIPRPLHRVALKVAHRLRHHWRKFSGITAEGVTIIACNPQGDILLVRHSYGPQGWYFPGGGIGRKETAEHAARREMREETGCRVTDLKLVGILNEEISGAPHRAHIFSTVVDAAPEPDGREIVEARFFAIRLLPEAMSALTRRRLELWQSWVN